MNALVIALWIVIVIQVFGTVSVLIRSGKPGGSTGGVLAATVVIQVFTLTVMFLAASAVTS